jgi:hypoxanthine phosphoribosyltransferase
VAVAADERVGEVYLDAASIAARVRELGGQISADYSGRDLVLVGLLKASFIFLADLSRALAVEHALDFAELAGYASDATGGHGRIRLLQDLSLDIHGRDVLLVEDVVDRPYRRLVDDLPVRYVGFTAPDEFFVGYGLDLDERYRNLPDLRLAKP